MIEITYKNKRNAKNSMIDHQSVATSIDSRFEVIKNSSAKKNIGIYRILDDLGARQVSMSHHRVGLVSPYMSNLETRVASSFGESNGDKQAATTFLVCWAPHADRMGFWMRSASTLAGSKFQILAEQTPALVFDTFWPF